MARLVLHIGTKKTGTTLIQNFLLQNRERLRAASWSYPDFLASRTHGALAFPFQRELTQGHQRHGMATPEDVDVKIEELGRNLERDVQTGSTWIVSSEHFSSRLQTTEEVQKAVTFLRRFFDHIDVVVAFRRQEFVLPSVYSQRLKEGFAASWTWDFCQRELPTLDYSAMYDRWTSANGVDRVRAIPYLEANKRDDTYLLRSFGDVTGIPIDDSWSGLNAVAKNRSLSAEGIAFLQIVNGYVPRTNPDGSSNLVMRQEMVERVAELTSGPPFRIDRNLLEQISTSCEESNRELIAKMPLNPQWKEWINQDTGRLATRGRVPDIDPQRAVELMVELAVPNGPASWGRVAAKPPRLREVMAERVRNRWARP